MTGYSIKKLIIKNFKFIKYESPETFNFENSDVLILNGQNGYGKTTLFDAIDFLINGRIKHFQEDLQNKGKSSIITLANNSNKEISIKAEIASDIETHIIERFYFCDNTNKLLIDENEASDNDLYSLLKSSYTLFNLGTYMSQSKSLDFLQNRFKNRKELISSLLNTTDETTKVDRINNIYVKTKEKVKQKETEYNSEIENLKNRIEFLITKTKDRTISTINYEKLFLKNEYDFDKEVLNFDKNDLEILLSEVNSINFFISKYDDYISFKFNKRINDIIKTDKKVFCALFFSQQIKYLNDRVNILEDVEKCTIQLKEIEEDNYKLNYELLKNIGVKENDLEYIKQQINNYSNYSNMLETGQALLLELQKARESLLKEHKKSAKQYSNLEKECPFCGTKHKDLFAVFSEYGKQLFKLSDASLDNVKLISTNLNESLNKNVIPIIKKFIDDNNKLVYFNNKLGNISNVSIDELRNNLKSFSFPFLSKSTETIDIDDFEKSYSDLIAKLKNKVKKVTYNFTNEEIELCELIHSKFYNCCKPYHTNIQIENKINYIKFAYFTICQRELKELIAQLKNKEAELEEYSLKSSELLESIDKIKNKYSKSLREYQSDLLSAIKIPLLIYSGKIIQNYPLGLGITTIIDDNKIQFSSTNKTDVDVFNILSTGQLNGLAISILLSIRNIYNQQDGMNVLLIDDPLQTLDDISSISLVDLLTQQNIKQIILSTHEESKANLFKYKFLKHDYSVLTENMQKRYIKYQSKE